MSLHGKRCVISQGIEKTVMGKKVHPVVYYHSRGELDDAQVEAYEQFELLFEQSTSIWPIKTKWDTKDYETAKRNGHMPTLVYNKDKLKTVTKFIPKEELYVLLSVVLGKSIKQIKQSPIIEGYKPLNLLRNALTRLETGGEHNYG